MRQQCYTSDLRSYLNAPVPFFLQRKRMLRQPPSPTGICVLERDTPVSDSQFLAHYSFVGRRQEPTQKEEQIHQLIVPQTVSLCCASPSRGSLSGTSEEGDGGRGLLPCPGRYLPTKQSRLRSQGATKARGLVLCLPASVLTTKLDNVPGKAPHPPKPPHSGFVPTRRHSNLSIRLACYQSVCLSFQPALYAPRWR